jgi:hypothetical protein
MGTPSKVAELDHTERGLAVFGFWLDRLLAAHKP